MEKRAITEARAGIAVRKYTQFKLCVQAMKQASIFEKAEIAEAALNSAVDVLGDLVFLINDLALNEAEHNG